MAQSPDHPELRFIEAEHFARGRRDGPPLWIVIHDMEAGETRERAENTANYFANPPDGRVVSSHYTVDSDSVVQCVLLGDVAWTVGNRPGNYRGINWELSGFASQTRTQWLDDFGIAMFNQIKPILRADAEEFDIPLRRCSVQDLRDFRAGITSHNDLRLAFGVTTHTDPGPNFPWDVFLQMMTEDDVTPEEIQEAVITAMSVLMNKAATRVDSTGRNYANWTYAVQRAADGFPTGDVNTPSTPGLEPRLDAIDAQLMEIKDLLAAGNTGAHTHEVTAGPAVPEPTE